MSVSLPWQLFFPDSFSYLTSLLHRQLFFPDSYSSKVAFFNGSFFFPGKFSLWAGFLPWQLLFPGRFSSLKAFLPNNFFPRHLLSWQLLFSDSLSSLAVFLFFMADFLSCQILFYHEGLPTNLFFSKINFISYCQFCIQKVFVFWIVVYNLNHQQIGGNWRKFEKKLQKLCCFLFRKGQFCSQTWPPSVRWSSLSAKLTFFLNKKQRNFCQIFSNFLKFPPIWWWFKL